MERFVAALLGLLTSLDLSATAQENDVSLLPVLLQVNRPLTEALRADAAREILQKGAWRSTSQALGDALLVDYKSGNVDQKPWIARLRLAQVCLWLGTEEVDLATPFITRKLEEQRRKFNHAEVREALKNPEMLTPLVSLFGDARNFPRPAILAARFKPETLIALLSNAELMDILGQTVTLQDYQPGVWRVLADLQEHAPQAVADWPALAVALAVVFDQGFPGDWPHFQVSRQSLPLVWGNWNALFDYFVQRQKEGLLLTDLRSLRADQLKFLVDVAVPISELEWAAQKVRQSRLGFDRVFGSIRYDTERLRAQQFIWPLPDYKLATIWKNGGICVDQAYYAWLAGKALGLPTLYFTGQGTDGGHAWFGYLREDAKWFMDAGRYQSQNYVTGSAWDPQNWQKINDHQLAFISDPGDTLVPYYYSRNILALAQLPLTTLNREKRAELLQAALDVNPRLPQLWDAVAQAWIEADATEDLTRHYRRMIDQFEKEDDVRLTALQALARLERTAGHTEEVEKLQQHMLALRSDLAIRAATELVENRMQDRDWAGAAGLYGDLLRQLTAGTKSQQEKEAGGNLFYDFVAPCVLEFQRGGQPALAQQALQLADARFTQESTAVVRQDMDKLRAELSHK